jgi:hypothetical protein
MSCLAQSRDALSRAKAHHERLIQTIGPAGY